MKEIIRTSPSNSPGRSTVQNHNFKDWLNSLDDKYVKIKIHGTETYLFGPYVQILLGFDHKEDNRYFFGDDEIDVLTFASIKKTYKLPYYRDLDPEGNKRFILRTEDHG